MNRNPKSRVKIQWKYESAGMAKLADAVDLGSTAERRAGSNPVPRTTLVFSELLSRVPPSLHSVRIITSLLQM
jgi:hypothetical protein